VCWRLFWSLIVWFACVSLICPAYYFCVFRLGLECIRFSLLFVPCVVVTHLRAHFALGRLATIAARAPSLCCRVDLVFLFTRRTSADTPNLQLTRKLRHLRLLLRNNQESHLPHVVGNCLAIIEYRRDSLSYSHFGIAFGRDYFYFSIGKCLGIDEPLPFGPLCVYLCTCVCCVHFSFVSFRFISQLTRNTRKSISCEKKGGE